MYSLPSSSYRRDPLPRRMNRGVPPTLRNARTGEFTPPGMRNFARSNSSSDLDGFFTGDHPVQEEVHHDLMKRSIQVAQEPGFQSGVGLRSGEEVLHQPVEPRAAPHEVH